ncbi:MAG: saccharopine dehydrogenase NADP-binding domain-containing protein [Desulfosarcina sp.]|nr:saccharopine dehydrogenase NADP-binding domain-containing protein [Desulfosarcina sp.]MBC2742711.1 saccharopine dehydrogenase NADP-binding domain-containing protein [Desulfosarcina sp.]MBC2765621.1 saccharopine dehydrogenase [Desulfosarcina sp.]
MKILVLGGCGIQGKAAVYDLAGSEAVEKVICADVNIDGIQTISAFTNMSKIRTVALDAGDSDSLDRLYRQADVVIDLLPRQFVEKTVEAAIRNAVSLVNTNYAYPVSHMHDKARAAGVAIMPECGLDPGIDLVLYGEAGRRFDELNVINSYCGGFPERTACDNPLNYKISWVFEGVLASTKRDSRMIRDGKVIDIPGARQHDLAYIHEVGFPGLGTLEAIPNGNAVFFTDALGVTGTIRETGRYSLRWPGWSAFWRPLKQLGFLREDPVAGLPCPVSPYRMMDKLLGPQLRYKRNEKDLVAMLNIFEGKKGEQRIRLVSRLLIERNLDTGLMAMAQGVGYPASIAAQMIAKGEITGKGVLSPMKHIPYPAFIDALRTRGIVVEEEETTLP